MSDSPIRRFIAADEGFRWADVELRRYKEEGAAPFRDVTRQTLFRRPDLRGELRYFEVAPSGHSTLERHAHVHAVMILRGSGEVLIDRDVHRVRAFDLVTVAPATWHQFRASPDAPLGFLCMVDAERDRPELPDAREIARLRESPAAAAFLDAAALR